MHVEMRARSSSCGVVAIYQTGVMQQKIVGGRIEYAGGMDKECVVRSGGGGSFGVSLNQSFCPRRAVTMRAVQSGMAAYEGRRRSSMREQRSLLLSADIRPLALRSSSTRFQRT